MADKNGKNATVKRPAVKPPVASFRFDQLAGQIWRERQGSRAFLATSSLKPAHLAGRGGSPVIARLPTIQRIAGSRHSLSASFTSRSRPAVRTPTDECATSRYSDNVRRSGTKFADSPLEEAVSSEPVSGPPISLLAGKLQGISSDSGVQRHILSAKQQQNQGLTGQFPTRFNREFFGGLAGN